MRKCKNRLIMLLMFGVYCAIFLVMVSLSSVLVRLASADTYKWVDEDGITQYSQSPPPGDIRYEVVKPPPAVETDDTADRTREQIKYLDEQARQRTEEKVEAGYRDKELAQRRSNCQLGRQRLASYANPRVSVTREDGTRERLSEQERQQLIRQSEEMIRDFCD